ncbi:hypothetical protein COT72_03770 [archaeon CG10_big_fil_rev_8_21_14_0_10_43_11]|nr:MAG: hypothetical protein COT72_03770 [archaeon CG10_big_fil_rev_8_21_14_0_10_43_11]
MREEYRLRLINELAQHLDRDRQMFRKKLIDYLIKIKQGHFEFAGYIAAAVGGDDEFLELNDLTDPTLTQKDLIQKADEWIKKLKKQI